MHRLLIDQNVRIEVAQALRDAGHDVIHLSELGFCQLDDDSIFFWAQAHQRTIVIFDADFAQHVLANRTAHAGVVRLKLEPQTPEHVLPPLSRFLATYPRERLENTLAVLAERKVRLRSAQDIAKGSS